MPVEINAVGKEEIVCLGNFGSKNCKLEDQSINMVPDKRVNAGSCI
jgi:hypothetical protein